MTELTVREAASLLGVSDDTVRRWGEAGRIGIRRGPNGRQSIDGAELAELAEQEAAASHLAAEFPSSRTSTRNKFTGLVTRVQVDGVMAQVDIQAGPFRVVSLLSREAVEELGLVVGSLAIATVKATNVSVEIPQEEK